jgi:F0F1-type ATP synthase membrane subunit c/vacuolar-type H+-ATPase subunit K
MIKFASLALGLGMLVAGTHAQRAGERAVRTTSAYHRSWP